MIPPRLHPVLVGAVAAVVLFWNLGGAALWDEDEPKNAACSTAMLDRGDWIVPTFNGRLRVEKPVLVNWVHIAGFSVAGRNETGARLGSACLTVGTAILTWHLAAILLGPEAGLLAGLAMASCIGTALSGRAATPDAPLAFCTTLGLWCFVAAGRGRPRGAPRDPRSLAGCGCALGAAMLAKGPVGLVLPLASFLAAEIWNACDDAEAVGVAGRARLVAARIRPGILVAGALVVALPWYVAVTLRTGGAWTEGFFLVHNVGRFAAPMEGHDGSAVLYYPLVLAVGFFPWSIVLAAALVHAAAVTRDAARVVAPQRRDGMRLLVCWLACWVMAFSAAGTKLPGYVWPAYPALAAITADFLAAWIRREAPSTARCREPGPALDRVMGLAWTILGLAGIGTALALVLLAPSLPALGRLAPIGVVPVAGALAALACQRHARRGWAVALLAGTAVLFVALLAGAGTDAVGGARGARHLVASLGERPGRGAWAGFGTIPPSVVFYAGDTIEPLESTEAVTGHLRSRPDAHLLVDSRYEMKLPERLPEGFGVLARRPQLFGPGLVVIGPVRDSAPPTRPEPPLAWNTPVLPR